MTGPLHPAPPTASAGSDASPRVSWRRVLLSRETLVGLLLVTLAATVCLGLGRWQWHRFEERRAEAAVIEANYDADPVALSRLLPTPGSTLAAEDDWQRVELRGEYCTDPGCVLYVRNRQYGGATGFYQLVPFRAEDGTVLLIVRGWVDSQDSASQPDDPAPVPAGELTLTARVRPAERVLDRERPEGQVHSINPQQIAADLPLDGEMVTGAYAVLDAEQPESARPIALPAPDTSLGPHLSYTVQWVLFAIFFPAALVYVLRRRLQDERDAVAAERSGPADESAPAPGTTPTMPEPAPATVAAAGGSTTELSSEQSTSRGRPRRTRTSTQPRTVARARRRGQDEEEEDALIDQQQP